jgi:hypothetical protein
MTDQATRYEVQSHGHNRVVIIDVTKNMVIKRFADRRSALKALAQLVKAGQITR